MAASSTQATLDLEFVGNAAGITDAVRASQRALAVLERQSATVSTTIGRAIRTIVTPIAGTILAAFAAKKALADFAGSNLPGAARFQQTMAVMRLAVRNLSNAVGEFLAPMAERTAKIITAIADTIAPLVRKVSAFVAASGGFFRVLGSNIIGALRPLLPTVFAFFGKVQSFFGGLDWDATFQRIRSAWNTAWSAALNFLAPIIVAASALIESTIAALRTGITALGSWLMALGQQIAAYFGITIPGATSAVTTAVQAVQFAILVAIGALKLAVENVPLLFEMVVAAAGVAIDYLRTNFGPIGDWLTKLFSVIGDNIGAVFESSFVTMFENVLVMMRRFGVAFSRGLVNLMAKALQNMLTMTADLWDKIPTPVKLLMGANGVAIDLSMKGLRSAAAGIGAVAASNGGGVTDEEINRQNPFSRFKVPDLKALPKFSSIPVDTAKLENLLSQIKDKFGPGIDALIRDALAKAPALAAAIAAGLPSVNGTPAGALDRGGNVGALLFGTAQAFVAENNSGSTNPLIPLAQAANNLSQQQLVEQRAATRAAERKFRLANF